MFQGDLEMIIKIKKSNKLYTSYSQGGALGLSRLSAVRSEDFGRLGFAFHLLIPRKAEDTKSNQFTKQ